MAKSSPGMAVADECKLKFLELTAKKKHRFIVFKIDEKIQQVMVEKLGKPDATYTDFAASLPADECRYAVYDLDLITDNAHRKSKVFFIAWFPDKSMATSKTIYASSKDIFKSELDDIQFGFVEAEKYKAVARKLQLENSMLKRELNVLKTKLSKSVKEVSCFRELSNERAKAPEEAKMHTANLKPSKGAEVPFKKDDVETDAKGRVGTSEGLGVANLDSAAGKQDKLTEEVEVRTASKINTVDAETAAESRVGSLHASGISKDDSQDKATKGDNSGNEAKEDGNEKV